MTKIYIASDHAGVELKSQILMTLRSQEYNKKFEIIDLGPDNTDSVDYPDYADKVCKQLHSLSVVNLSNNSSPHPADYGILICGSGQGMSMRANKYNHIRAALCWSPEIARLAREHNDANVLCLGARFLNAESALTIVNEFLLTPFAGGRHRQRIVKVASPI